jgi:DNA repair protein RadA/Sms
MKGKYPLRVSVGLDSGRLDMIIAIIEKYGKINLSFSDIFINIPGELEYRDSGLDLALAMGIYKQYK